MRSAREVLRALESCFDADEVETSIGITDPPGQTVGGELVRIVHRPTGREFVGDGHTQVQNKIVALLELLSTQVSALSL